MSGNRQPTAMALSRSLGLVVQAPSEGPREEELGETAVQTPSTSTISDISCSEIATFFNFVKACIGSGTFPLPWGILQAGVVVGGFGMILLGIARSAVAYPLCMLLL